MSVKPWWNWTANPVQACGGNSRVPSTDSARGWLVERSAKAAGAIGILAVSALLASACGSKKVTFQISQDGLAAELHGASDAGIPRPGDGADAGAAMVSARPRETYSGAPIVAPADQWTWVDFPGSRCALGTPTGIAVNPHAGATDLLIYFEGGGVCADANTCWGVPPTAKHLNGYDAAIFYTEIQHTYPILVRGQTANPFRALNMAYIPYCTGDLHAGTAEVDMVVNGATKPTYFWGAKDLEQFLARLVPTFSQAHHIWVAGTSAGGCATFLNFDRIARAFGSGVRVDILDDSGPPFTDNSAKFLIWGFVAPAGCASCNTMRGVLAFDRQSQPQSKFGFLSFAEDTVVCKLNGYKLWTYPARIHAFSASLVGDPNAATYIVTHKKSHVVESDPSLAPDYLPWMTLMSTDDPSWGDVTYQHP